MATGATIQLPTDAAANKNVVDASTVTNPTPTTVYRTVQVIGDPNIFAAQAGVMNAAMVGTEYGQLVRPIMSDVVAGPTAITATDAVVAAQAGDGVLKSGASTAGSIVSVAAPGGDAGWICQVTGSWTGTLNFEGSMDSTTGTDGNWIAINGRQTGIVNTVLTYQPTTNGVYRGNASGMKYIRVRQVVGTTFPTIIIRLSDGEGATFLNASVPAGSNLIGALYHDVIPSVAGVAQTPLFAPITQAVTASTALVAAVGGKKIRVLSLTLIAGGATNVTILQGTTAVTGALPLVANTGFSASHPNGIFETAVGAALNLSQSAAIQVSGFLTYITA